MLTEKSLRPPKWREWGRSDSSHGISTNCHSATSPASWARPRVDCGFAGRLGSAHRGEPGSAPRAQVWLRRRFQPEILDRCIRDDDARLETALFRQIHRIPLFTGLERARLFLAARTLKHRMHYRRLCVGHTAMSSTRLTRELLS